MHSTGPARRIPALIVAFSALALITSVNFPKLDGSSTETTYAAPLTITEFGASALDAKGKEALY